MDFGFDETTERYRDRLLAFMDEFVYPAEETLRGDTESAGAQSAGAQSVGAQSTGAQSTGGRWQQPVIVEDLKKAARERGLWNLFLPGEFGAGLTNLQYAPLAEITGRSPALAPVALNCSSPDSGNMEILAEFGTQQQRERWLRPLLDGRIRSAFAMTEPGVASSDATNIATLITRDGGEYVINGRKWFITGAMDPNCEIFIVMGKTDPTAPRHRQQSQVLVPRDTPGVRVRRGMGLFGYDDGDHGGHAEIDFEDVRVPVENLLAGEGDGFAISQARLGPGRIHHCARLIGMAERAVELSCRRVNDRTAFGHPLADQGVIQDRIAESRVRIEQARLLILKAAWLMDTVGNRGAHTEIQAIKIVTPSTVEWIIDQAIQAHGAAGVSQDLPLARLWAAARSLRIADGPDEVHRRSLARRELRRWSAG